MPFKPVRGDNGSVTGTTGTDDNNLVTVELRLRAFAMTLGGDPDKFVLHEPARQNVQ